MLPPQNGVAVPNHECLDAERTITTLGLPFFCMHCRYDARLHADNLQEAADHRIRRIDLVLPYILCISSHHCREVTPAYAMHCTIVSSSWSLAPHLGNPVTARHSLAGVAYDVTLLQVQYKA